MWKPAWSRRDSLYFALIGLAEFLIFFNDPGHFFMGDTLLWMGYRYRSITGFLAGLIQLDPTLWYRPLAQRTVESLLYPFVGMHPVPYHVVMFVLFFACTIAVFMVTDCITGSRRAAWFAILFFAPHVTHAVTTYDTAFAPEIIFTIFFIGSVISFAGYLRTQSRSSLIASVVFFLGSLLSKETGVAVPFTLVAVWLFLPTGKRASLRSLAPHFLILAAYLVFTIGFLHIRAINVRQLIENPGTAGQSGYQLVLGKNVLETTGHAFSWAFSIPRGMYGQWGRDVSREPGYALISALRAVRALILVAALFVLFTPYRRYLLIGLAWFLIAAGPTLPLLNHFLPYYLFGPMVGFSLAVGAVLDWTYQHCAKFSPRLACASCALLILVPAGINADTASGIAKGYLLCGRSSRQALSQLTDMRALHPELPSGTKLLFFDEEDGGTSWNEAHGMMFQMAYGDESIKSEYLTDGVPISITANDIQGGKAFAFKLANTHFVDITSFVKQRPDLLVPHNQDENYHLKLSKSEVRAESDSYIAQVPELHGAMVRVLRAHNGVVEEPFVVQLDDMGQMEFKVGNETIPGTYTFVAIQRVGEPNWVIVSGSVRVNNS